MVEPLGQAHKGECLTRVEWFFGDLGHERNILQHREAGNQIVELKHEPDMLAPVAGQIRIVSLSQIMIAPNRYRARREY